LRETTARGTPQRLRAGGATKSAFFAVQPATTSAAKPQRLRDNLLTSARVTQGSGAA